MHPDIKLELNEEKLAEALAAVLNDKTLLQKLSKNARSGQEQSYTVENMGDATIKQYRKLLIQKGYVFNSLKNIKLMDIVQSNNR